ncbi:NAD(P)/FAD-dependent oxidoreductase [Kitasatospora sp. NPDC096147]|uniref:NAD(P)/FAD-dependent oxidoreductase n=1 Tax=Kitasatospora sp. NPDC096147 TaxID=3364093 RepID=UPI003817D085
MEDAAGRAPAVHHALTPERGGPIRILIVGGGCAGTATALRLQQLLKAELRDGRTEITLVEPRPYLTYQPLLAEVAAGSVDPRHVVVPLRRLLPECRVLTARVVRIEHAERRVTLTPVDRDGAVELTELPYDVLVVAPGSVSRTAPVPGLAEHGLGFATVGEAVALRNHVLEQLDLASTTRDPELRQAALTFVFVGAGYAGVGALAELEDMARYAAKGYHNLQPEDLRWVLVEARDRILPEEPPELADHTLAELRERSIDVRLSTTLESAADRRMALSDGSCFAARTLVWTAGVRPAPLLRDSDLPLDRHGRVRCLPTLQAAGPDGVAVTGLWSAGDCAAVPDPTAPERLGHPADCAPNAQHAVAQATLLAENLAAALTDRPLTPYQPGRLSCSTSLGLRRAVAHTSRGGRLTGRRAWWLHRARHLRGLPSRERRIRVLTGWLLGGLFHREVVSLGAVEHPRSEFQAGFKP